MNFYTYTYKVLTENEKAFKYFLKKEYLVKFFPKNEKVKLISDNNLDIINEGDLLTLVLKDEESITKLKIEVDEIKVNELISYRLFLNEIEDNESEDIDEEEFSTFMETFIGKEIKYKIRFTQKSKHLIITEENSIVVNKIWKKVFWKILGLYYMIKQRKTHKQVKKELEKL